MFNITFLLITKHYSFNQQSIFLSVSYKHVRCVQQQTKKTKQKLNKKFTNTKSIFVIIFQHFEKQK